MSWIDWTATEITDTDSHDRNRKIKANGLGTGRTNPGQGFPTNANLAIICINHRNNDFILPSYNISLFWMNELHLK